MQTTENQPKKMLQHCLTYTNTTLNKTTPLNSY